MSGDVDCQHDSEDRCTNLLRLTAPVPRISNRRERGDEEDDNERHTFLSSLGGIAVKAWGESLTQRHSRRRGRERGVEAVRGPRR